MDPSGHAPWDWVEEHIVDPVVETVDDVSNAFTSFSQTIFGFGTQPPSLGPDSGSSGSYDPTPKLDPRVENLGKSAQETLTNEARVLVSQGTENSVERAYRSGDQRAINIAVGFAAGEAIFNIATVAVIVKGGSVLGAGKLGQRTDYIRFGITIVSKQLVQGHGARGAIRTWGIK